MCDTHGGSSKFYYLYAGDSSSKCGSRTVIHYDCGGVWHSAISINSTFACSFSHSYLNGVPPNTYIQYGGACVQVPGDIAMPIRIIQEGI